MDVKYIILQWLLAGFATLVAILFLYQKFRVFTYWKDRSVPYAKPAPFLGNLTFMLRKSAWDFFSELRVKHPLDYVGVYLGWQPALVVQTPDLARQVLVKNADHFQDRYLFANKDDPLGALNLFTVKNPIWTNMRHELSPMFTSNRLRMVTELMNLNALELVKKVQRDYIEKKMPVNLKVLFSMYTSDTVGFSVFGLRVSSLSDQDSPLWAITSHMVKWTFMRGFEFTMIFFMPFVANFLKLKFFSVTATDYIKKLFWNVVNERKNSDNNDGKDLVNHLLKLKENLKLPADADSKLADELMLAQAAVFILGSVETSSTTLSYCLHELAHHPEIQDKLFEEVSDAFTQKGKEVLEYDDLMDLKYLSACIFETMRKHAPVPYLDRICAKPLVLDGVQIEKGVPVLVNVVGLHQNPDYFPEPERWNPDRKCAASDNDNLGFTFLPFGDGPHFCIGKRYGMMQIRAALSQLVRKYRVEPGPVPYQVESDPYSVLLAPKNGGSVKFIPRCQD